MKQGRTPDRVHVVRPPENDSHGANGVPATQGQNRAMEIIRTLAQISDKLKRSEAERYELLAELREYRKSLHELEDKADKSEKAYLALENKIKSSGAADPEILQRQARFERALKDAESKLVQAAAGQSLLDKRISDAEAYQAGVTQRLDETIMQQARLDRSLEKIGQDKTRVLRKVERMEEILTETQDTLKARALVLLTDQSSAAASPFPQIAAYTGEPASANTDMPWWRKSVRLQGVGMASMIVAALLFGWAINQVQQPDIPKIAVLENGGLARLNLENNTWEPVSATAANAPTMSQTPESDATLIESEQNAVDALNRPAPDENAQTPAADAAINASDEQLMKALEEDPEGLASQLNEIAPGAANELTATDTAALPPATGYDPLKSAGEKAFAQDPQVANLVAKEKGTAALNKRIASDSTLPASLQALEAQAYAGVPEAQHDLAAIYTAGRAGVTQNFERAAQWFREAADNGIANASYNLGVLYHQGLGVERDLDRALYWYREAAKKGHPEAQYNLGISYIEGIGVEYNAPLAASFFESSANQGIVEAAYNLGLIYENGLIGGANKQEDALMWYKIAADGGSTDAKAALAQLSSNMGIDDAAVNKLVDKMQGLYTSSKGRRAGPDGNAKSVQAPRPNKEIVAEIQNILKNENMYEGSANGLADPQTVDAIRQYQASHGMKVTGLATQDLLAAMKAGQ